MKFQAEIAIAASFFMLLAACSAEPRSAEYFANHLDESDQLAKDCALGTTHGAECDNAALANLRAKNKAGYQEEARKSAEAMKSGNFMPTIRR